MAGWRKHIRRFSYGMGDDIHMLNSISYEKSCGSRTVSPMSMVAMPFNLAIMNSLSGTIRHLNHWITRHLATTTMRHLLASFAGDDID